MTLTDVAAWVGAVTGSLGFGWDVYKWRQRGADVHLDLRPNMVVAGPGPESRPSFVVVEVTNRGAMPTTLTLLIGEQYKTLWQRVRAKPEYGLYISQGGNLNQLPHVLGPGERWLGQIAQAELEPLLKGARVRVGICHTAKRNGIVYKWVQIPG
jgi:hypothetical protein